MRPPAILILTLMVAAIAFAILILAVPDNSGLYGDHYLVRNGDIHQIVKNSTMHFDLLSYLSRL